MTYKEWLWEVNRILIKNTGLGRNDLPDWDYYDAYECDVTPEQTAFDVLESTGMWEGTWEEFAQ